MSITAKVLADSTSPTGKRIVTFELTYPRYIHAEFMTHRVFSRNAASSRAIPFKKLLQRVQEDPAIPIHWGKNEPGMQANSEVDELERTPTRAGSG
jgi:thymidylate synthase ThyX